MTIKQSILKTLGFFDLFNYPLTAEEVMDYLYKNQKAVHIKEIKGTLNELKEEGKVDQIHDFWMLKGREKTLEARKQNKVISKALWQKVNHYAGYMVHVPFIQMIAVCNTLSYYNANSLSDIDLLIVVKPGRLWTARLMITMLLQFFGVRRHGNKIAGRFCLSFFVTENQLDMSTFELKPEDPYLAYWVKTIKPIYGKETFEKFKSVNQDWLKSKYGLEMKSDQLDQLIFDRKSWIKQLKEWALKGWFGNLVEWIIQKMLKPRTLKKAALVPKPNGIVIENDVLKFHNKDRRAEYYKTWHKNTRT